jgi:geranylgeranylglycerol-phosphate geranylgeranyltransferase
MGLYRIMRPVNSLVAGLAAVLAYLLATGTLVPAVLFLFVIVVLITGAGNAINDYFDFQTDLINRPERSLPSGVVTKKEVIIFAGVMFISGIGISLFTNIICIFFTTCNSLLLIFYAAKLKSTPLAGNIAIAYLSGSIFLFGGGFAGIFGLWNNIVIALVTFFAMAARELMKDAEDVPGDAASGAKTFPILYGVRPAIIIAVIFATGAVLISLFPYFRWGTWYLVGILIVDGIILYSAFCLLRCMDPGCIKKSRATTVIKYGMYASLVVFTLSALLLSG